MFTGIITDIGRVAAIEKRGDTLFTLSTGYDVSTVDLGASIACSGICLTVVDKGADQTGQNWFAVEVSAESMDTGNIGGWQVGGPVNLERSLRLGDEMGGHIVSGHVDGVAEILSIVEDGDSLRFTFKVSDKIKKFIAPKGSVALNGVSLTVNEVDDDTFGVNIISHTQAHTTFGEAKAGDKVNLEIDVLARYVSRLTEGV